MILGICKSADTKDRRVWHRRDLAFCYRECNGATEPDGRHVAQVGRGRGSWQQHMAQRWGTWETCTWR